jgi:hypothetical protein
MARRCSKRWRSRAAVHRLWIEGLSLDEAIRLAEALLEVNADFFIRQREPGS